MGKRLVMFIDDLNMPRVDLYGTQQPIALLKLFVERKGLYDRGKELGWKHMKDVQVAGAMGPPGGARNPVDPRFMSLFNVFEIQFPSNDNLRTIYQVRELRGNGPHPVHTIHTYVPQAILSRYSLFTPSTHHSHQCTAGLPVPPHFVHTIYTIHTNVLQAILSRHLVKLPTEEIKAVLGEKLTDVTLELYNFICDKLPPTPSRFHYVFNLRDLSRIYEVRRGIGWKCACSGRVGEE